MVLFIVLRKKQPQALVHSNTFQKSKEQRVSEWKKIQGQDFGKGRTLLRRSLPDNNNSTQTKMLSVLIMNNAFSCCAEQQGHRDTGLCSHNLSAQTVLIQGLLVSGYRTSTSRWKRSYQGQLPGAGPKPRQKPSPICLHLASAARTTHDREPG